MDLVKKLKKSYTLYTMNNEGKEWMDLRIQKFGLRKYFKGFITSGYVGHAKPDPEIYKILLKKSGLKPTEHIFIDNKEVNLAPARNLGFRTILFKSIEQLKKDLIALGVRVD
jgi:FMN phosphatase YigB (HAD superfamily)